MPLAIMLALSLVFVNSCLAIAFFSSHTPVFMALILIFLAVSSCGVTGVLGGDFWFSYILFLVFVGGVLIIFTYMVSLAPNKKMGGLNLVLALTGIGALAGAASFIALDFSYWGSSVLEHFTSAQEWADVGHRSGELYSMNYVFVTGFSIIYLLLILVLVVKLIESTGGGSLRGKN